MENAKSIKVGLIICIIVCLLGVLAWFIMSTNNHTTVCEQCGKRVESRLIWVDDQGRKLCPQCYADSNGANKSIEEKALEDLLKNQ